MFEDEGQASSLDPSDEDVPALLVHYGSYLRQVGWIEHDLIDVLEGPRAADNAADLRTEHGVFAHGAGPERRIHGAIGEGVLPEQAPRLSKNQDLGMGRRIVQLGLSISRARDYSAILDQNRTHGAFTAVIRRLRFKQGFSHEGTVIHERSVVSWCL